MSLLASAYCDIEQPYTGLEYVTDALAKIKKSSERWFEAEIHRHRGNVLLCPLARDELAAEASFRRALSVARKRHAKLWELRAATSMARLWRDQGRRSEARELLAPVYGWFTEGFDTADLKEAKALLDQLQG